MRVILLLDAKSSFKTKHINIKKNQNVILYQSTFLFLVTSLLVTHLIVSQKSARNSLNLNWTMTLSNLNASLAQHLQLNLYLASARSSSNICSTCLHEIVFSRSSTKKGGAISPALHRKCGANVRLPESFSG